LRLPLTGELEPPRDLVIAQEIAMMDLLAASGIARLHTLVIIDHHHALLPGLVTKSQLAAHEKPSRALTGVIADDELATSEVQLPGGVTRGCSITHDMEPLELDTALDAGASSYRCCVDLTCSRCHLRTCWFWRC
jgi:hypothetical protein